MGIEFEFNLDLDRLVSTEEAVTPEALQKAGEHIGEVSAQQVPIEEGTLLRSQKVTVEGTVVAISYDTPYAIYVHEILRNKHPHGNAKFLELPLLAEGRTALGIVANDIKQAL
jgi:hypothetical protein